MLISELEADKLTDNQMTKLLYTGIHDDLQNGDCIFVPGSSMAVKYRLPKAVELYHEGRAEKVLFSGGVTWPGNPYPEAGMLKVEAMKLGVRAEDILVEDRSLHTKENVLASLLILDREFYLHNIERLIVVSTHYHLRRMHLTLKTYMPNWIHFTLCPTHDRRTNEDNWFHTEIGRKRVQTECEKLIRYVKLGVLIDEAIDI